jgi:quinol monooxygenase YgiN
MNGAAVNESGFLVRATPAEGGAQEQPTPARREAVRDRDDVAVLLLADIAPSSRTWGWSRIIWGRLLLRGVKGLLMAKALGSGHQGGFGLRPSGSRQGLFTLFDSEAAADEFLADSPVLAAYAQRSDEFLMFKLRAISSRGTWGGRHIAITALGATGAPVAALTRASIKPWCAARFWRHSPPSEQALREADGCQLAVGLGEAPLLRQATFSVWDNQAAMDAYARSGAHLQAIHAAAVGGFFSESMFVRFVPLMMQGRWLGRSYG